VDRRGRTAPRADRGERHRDGAQTSGAAGLR